MSADYLVYYAIHNFEVVPASRKLDRKLSFTTKTVLI